MEGRRTHLSPRTVPYGPSTHPLPSPRTAAGRWERRTGVSVVEQAEANPLLEDIGGGTSEASPQAGRTRDPLAYGRGKEGAVGTTPKPPPSSSGPPSGGGRAEPRQRRALHTAPATAGRKAPDSGYVRSAEARTAGAAAAAEAELYGLGRGGPAGDVGDVTDYEASAATLTTTDFATTTTGPSGGALDDGAGANAADVDEPVVSTPYTPAEEATQAAATVAAALGERRRAGGTRKRTTAAQQ
jgi:hypothetical protein